MFSGIPDSTPVSLTLFTDALEINGTIRTRHRRVTDILNQAEHPYLVLSGVTMRRLSGGGSPVESEHAQVNLAAVLFAVADDPVEIRPELRMPKMPERALISIPPFEISGTIHLLPTGDLREALQELSSGFLPVTEATYGSETLRLPPRHVLLAAVNQRRAQILASIRDGG
jgi:hypothetical protein